MNTITLADLHLLNIKTIRDLEANTINEIPHANLIKKAGKATANLAKQLIKKKALPALILAGPGNNGGDACATAAELAKDGYSVIVILCADPEKYSADGKKAFDKALSRKVIVKNSDALDDLLKLDFSIIIDGLFGIGLKRAISGIYEKAINGANQLAHKKQIFILSIDVPSGLNADTGTLVTDDADKNVAVKADATITFIANKPGLHTADGKDYAGEVIVNDLGIQSPVTEESKLLLNHASRFNFQLPERKQNSHKGSYGEVIVIGGDKGMLGASVLAARTALYSGAGKVNVSLLHPAIDYDTLHPEIMYKDAQHLQMKEEIVVIGPGMGHSDIAKTILSKALSSEISLVIDADALNLIAANKELNDLLMGRTASSILTPHPLEAARLLHISAKEVQQDRCKAALLLANKFKCVVVLKGSGTIITDPEGRLRINTTGNPGLATGGSGDVLAGLCGALLAQGLNSFETAQLAVWLHGAAADTLVEAGVGPIGMIASELPEAIRHCLNAFVDNQRLAN
ncbi:NAD(P)H-hydrate dehydratase [Undibacterium sp. Dicai25W]|uniref:NAD(P)H-hydrate dehydratase n=1 Tax=Undibacterium sp. Dicai25W TaxID=3413034 RepID=UPI003BF2E365